MVAYDPSVIQQFAEKLYAQARSVLALGALVGFIVGLIGGAMVGNVLGGSGNAGSGGLFGGLVGALLGYSLAQGRAFALKLTAQTALCQAQIEANTRQLAERVSEPVQRVA